MGDGLTFSGFSTDTLRFLHGIVHNNSKSWLEENRGEYERVLLEPMKALVRLLGPEVAKIDPRIDTRPAVGRTISRIFRDVRFSNDKSPLRANMWVVFKRPGDEGLHIPTFYFDLSFDHWSYGMGFYAATPDYMKRFRERILARPEPFLECLRSIDPTLLLLGESYARPPVKTAPEGMTPDTFAALIPFLTRKNFYWSCRRDPGGELLSGELTELLSGAFRSLGPVYRFLAEGV